MRTSFLLGATVALSACTGDAGLTVYDIEPSVSITAPTDGAVFEEGETITFTGVIQDDRPIEELDFRWVSSVDGELASLDVPDAEGNVELTTATLSPGVHVIELHAVDGDGQDGSDNITLTIEEITELPSIRVLVPSGDSADAPMGQAFNMLVNVDDEQDPVDQLVVTASDDINGLLCNIVPDKAGDAQCTYTWANLGNYLVTFEVTDTDGNSARANLALRVLDPLDFDTDGDGVSPNSGDCNDSNNTVYPGADELCDGLDNDCKSETAIDVGTECYDDDGDGFCEEPPCANASAGLADCNDADASVNPPAQEKINGVDDDCDTHIDEDTSVYDDDGDGFCESGNCINASGTQSDCDDGNILISPATTEDCATAYDDNCDGQTNDQDAIGCTNYYYDNDGDGYGIPGDTECWCNGGMPPFTGTNTNDCYDANADAHPGQAGWFASDRGDNSFDYNCDNAQEKRYNDQNYGCFAEFEPFTCNTQGEGSTGTGDGWAGTNPACGATGSYVNDCYSSYDTYCMALCVVGGDYAACTQCYECGPNAHSQQQQCR